MAHIFFEKLENRRSTQSLYGWNNIFDSMWKPEYKPPATQFTAYYGTQIPTTPANASSWGASWNNGSSIPSILNNSVPSNSSSSSWIGLPSTPQVSASKFLTPVYNFLGGLFGLQSSPWAVYPGYPRGTSPGQVVPLYAAQVPGPTTYYGVNLPSTPSTYTPPSTSYSPPSSPMWALYGISVSQPTTPYWR